MESDRCGKSVSEAYNVAMRSDTLATALGRMARTVSEALELKEVFARVAEAAATVVPFDTMVVFRVEGPDAFALYSFAGIIPDAPHTIRLADSGDLVAGKIVRLIDSDDAVPAAGFLL